MSDNLEDSGRNPVFGIETYGCDFIPESQRSLSVRNVGVFWCGTSAYIFHLTVGVIAFSYGLPLWIVLTVLIVGNVSWALVGIMSVAAARTGRPTLMITKVVFGRLGNAPSALLAWFRHTCFEAIATVLGVFALAPLLTQPPVNMSPVLAKVIGIVIIFGFTSLVAVLGHATMIWFQRVFAGALMAVMIAVFIATVGNMDWWATAPSPAGGADGGSFVALIAVLAFVVASGPLTYVSMAADYPRYLPTKTSAKSIIVAVTAGAGGSTAFLGVVGAMLAAKSGKIDAVAGASSVLPAWLYVVFVITVVGGVVSNTAPTLYSSGLTLQAMGFNYPRWAMTLVSLVIAVGIICYALFVADFTTALSSFLLIYLVWGGPFLGVWLTDGLIRRWRYDLALEPGNRGVSAAANWRGIIALMIGAGTAVLLIDTPVFRGPLVAALHGIDLSWLIPPLVASGAYYLIARSSVRKELREATTTHVNVVPAATGSPNESVGD